MQFDVLNRLCRRASGGDALCDRCGAPRRGGVMRRCTSMVLACAAATAAASAAADAPGRAGPFNAHFLAGGIGIDDSAQPVASLAAAGTATTTVAWVRPDLDQHGRTVLLALGDDRASRALLLDNGHPAYAAGDAEA